MTLEEACRLIDPATDLDALAEIEYYNGFKGKEAAAKTLREASQMVVDFVRRVSTMKAGRAWEKSTAAS